MDIYGQFTDVSQGWSTDDRNDSCVLYQRMGRGVMGNEDVLDRDLSIMQIVWNKGWRIRWVWLGAWTPILSSIPPRRSERDTRLICSCYHSLSAFILFFTCICLHVSGGSHSLGRNLRKPPFYNTSIWCVRCGHKASQHVWGWRGQPKATFVVSTH